MSLEMKDAIRKCTYPEYQNGGKVTAKPDGTLLAEGREYHYLFWEAEALFPFSLKSGTCVAGKDTCKFLEESLTKLRLNDKEQEDFITYWLPEMQDHPYNVISFPSPASFIGSGNPLKSWVSAIFFVTQKCISGLT